MFIIALLTKPAAAAAAKSLQSCPTLYDPMDHSIQAPLSSVISWGLLRFMSVDSLVLSKHLLLYRPLLLAYKWGLNLHTSEDDCIFVEHIATDLNNC